MKETSLVYIMKDDSCLMLHRIRKEHDVNHGKWIGVGGKFEPGESPEECMRREVREETGPRKTEKLRGRRPGMASGQRADKDSALGRGPDFSVSYSVPEIPIFLSEAGLQGRRAAAVRAQ